MCFGGACVRVVRAAEGVQPVLLLVSCDLSTAAATAVGCRALCGQPCSCSAAPCKSRAPVRQHNLVKLRAKHRVHCPRQARSPPGATAGVRASRRASRTPAAARGTPAPTSCTTQHRSATTTTSCCVSPTTSSFVKCAVQTSHASPLVCGSSCCTNWCPRPTPLRLLTPCAPASTARLSAASPHNLVAPHITRCLVSAFTVAAATGTGGAAERKHHVQM